MARWLVRSPGAEPVGPLDASELRAAWKRGDVVPDTMVCAEGFSRWVPFHAVGELVETGAPTRAAPQPGISRPLTTVLLVLVLFGVGVMVLVGVVGVRVASSASNFSINPCSR
jgi:hypothetical protein